ncbi:hypothetical protein B0H11DRAFT_1922194 [Mycena galericulata]|nr:hypothetical protein B0H11DRAFT_1922194 [Mycena galericulata]
MPSTSSTYSALSPLRTIPAPLYDNSMRFSRSSPNSRGYTGNAGTGSVWHPNPHWERNRQIYQHWYTTSTPLPPAFSCNWFYWGGIKFFLPRTAFGEKEERSEVQAILTEACGILGTIMPIAYVESHTAHYFLFVADGVYYEYDDGASEFRRFDKETYVDHLEFIRRVASHTDLDAISTTLQIPKEASDRWDSKGEDTEPY